MIPGEALGVVPGDKVIVWANAAGPSARAATAKRALGMAFPFGAVLQTLACKLYSRSYSLSRRRALPP